MVDRRALLGTGAVLVGMGSALLTTTAVAAADSGDIDSGQQASAPSAVTSNTATSTRRAAARAGAAAPGANRAT
ncbi:MAG: hypothetical protein ACR2JI_04740, partial [Mycobacterium sp.]